MSSKNKYKLKMARIANSRKGLLVSSIIAIILLLACGNNGCKKYDKNFILENHNYKIWEVRRDSINKGSAYNYYFDDKFNCYNMIFNYHTGNFEKFYYDDVIMEHKWAINGDTLFIEMLPYLILGKDNDTIYLEYMFRNMAYGRKVFLVDMGIPPADTSIEPTIINYEFCTNIYDSLSALKHKDLHFTMPKGTYLQHANVYLAQMDCSEFVKTSEDYKFKVMCNFVNCLCSGYNNKQLCYEDIDKKQNEFNNSVGKRVGATMEINKVNEGYFMDNMFIIVSTIILSIKINFNNKKYEEKTFYN